MKRTLFQYYLFCKYGFVLILYGLSIWATVAWFGWKLFIVLAGFGVARAIETARQEK